MPKITMIKPKIKELPVKKRVAAYARVSMDTERLMHSISAQISYYSELIQKNPEWEYVGVYADFGISGTRIEKRTEFSRMLRDCEDGKIDIILCKSISSRRKAAAFRKTANGASANDSNRVKLVRRTSICSVIVTMKKKDSMSSFLKKRKSSEKCSPCILTAFR